VKALSGNGLHIGLGLVAALVLSACVDAGGALTIVQNQVPTMGMSAAEQQCVIPSTASTARNALGTYDVALDHSYPYYMYPLLHNGLPMITGNVDPNLIEVTRWSVKIEAPPTVSVPWNPGCPAEFDYPNPLSLHPGDQASAVVEAMRPCHGDLLRQLMQQGKISASFSERVIFRLIVRAKGRHGATEIKSDPFEFPVRVCYGCLQTGYGTKDYADFAFPKVPACSKLTGDNPFKGNLCNPAQDVGPLLCCALDAEGKTLECPGIPRGTAAAGP
jgi:hypothetical protein